MKKLGIVLVIAALSFGCSVHQRGFTFISTKNVELSRVDMAKTQVVRDQKGSDSRFWVLCIPFAGNPTLENAVNECLEDGDGDFIISPEVRSTGWSILLFSYGSWHVKGDVGNSLSNKSPEQIQPTTVD